MGQLDISKTIMSDHNIIEVTINLKDCNELTSNNDEATEIDETDLRQLNFHHKNVSWDEIKEMPWTELFNGKNNEECTEIFIYFIRIICFWKIPKKNKNKNHIRKERKKKY